VTSHFRSIAAVFTVGLLAACAGGADWGTAVTPGGNAAASNVAQGSNAAGAVQRRKGTLVVRIGIPRRKRKHRVIRILRFGKPQYISASAAGMTIATTSGPTRVKRTISLEPNSSSCRAGNATCTIEIDLKPGKYTASFATYDAVSCNGTACSIPASANELSGNQDVSFTIKAATANVVKVTLDGVVASLALVPGSSASLSGNAASGYTISKCLASESDRVYGVDADGNYIIGAGAPTIALTSSGSALAVSSPSPSSPNTFTFAGAFANGTPSDHDTIPSAGSSVRLTASFTPAGGGATVSYKATVKFDSTICGVLTEYPIGTTNGYYDPRAIVAGPDGNLWFTESNNSGGSVGNGYGYIGKITTAGVLTQYTSGILPDTYGIAVGPDGNLWYTTDAGSGGSVGRITTSGVSSDANNYPYDQTSPRGIVTGPDGRLWIANNYPGGEIDTMAASTPASPSPYTIEPSPQPSAYPEQIANGPDGNLWFTDYNDRIWKVTPGGVFTPYSNGISTNAAPQGIVAGPDGRLWFTESGCPFVGMSCTPIDKIGAITTGGAVTEYQTGITSPAEPYFITTGPDGNLWFTEHEPGSRARIAKVTISGTGAVSITEYSLSSTSGAPAAITTGPDGSLWFTEDGYSTNNGASAIGNQIGRWQ
jgi:streptogramin lyase